MSSQPQIPYNQTILQNLVANKDLYYLYNLCIVQTVTSIPSRGGVSLANILFMRGLAYVQRATRWPIG